MDAVRSILPSYYRLVKSPPNNRNTVAPYRPIEEPSDEDAIIRERYEFPTRKLLKVLHKICLCLYIFMKIQLLERHRPDWLPF